MALRHGDDPAAPAAVPDRENRKAGDAAMAPKKRRRHRARARQHNKGTPLYGIKHCMDLFVMVATLLAHGCLLQAIVAVFELDECTVRGWYLKAVRTVSRCRIR